jgi:hypothetical protein
MLHGALQYLAVAETVRYMANNKTLSSSCLQMFNILIVPLRINNLNIVHPYELKFCYDHNG